MKRLLTIKIFFLLIAVIVFGLPGKAQSRNKTKITKTHMALVRGGYYTPLFKQNGNTEKTFVKTFFLDVHAVTNRQFLEFVKANPEWSRSKVKRIFADNLYLKNWEGDFNPGKNINLSAPVTYVSWYAANAYSKWVGKRLPTTPEWELAALADKNNPIHKRDKKFTEKLIRWYSSDLPKYIADVKSTGKNYWGIYDMFGLVREWTFDFSSTNINGSSICGGGSIGATDLTNYPAFLRYGFNSCLEASSTLGNLGFRCAKDFKK